MFVFSERLPGDGEDLDDDSDDDTDEEDIDDEDDMIDGLEDDVDDASDDGTVTISVIRKYVVKKKIKIF